MKAISFNEHWFVKHLEAEGKGKEVCLPHDAMLEEPRTKDALGGLNVGWFEGRDYLYSKNFELTKEQAEGHLVLEFEGVYRKAEVFVNGKKAAFRPYGYTNFYVELDGLVQEGENNVEVIARNSDQPNSRWYSGAGIYRPVTLWCSGKEYIKPDGVKIRTISIHPAVVEVQIETCGEGEAEVRIFKGDTVIAESRGEGRSYRFTVENAALWDAEHPELYIFKVSFKEDTYSCHFGIRTLEWGQKGFLVNGQRVILRGACIHHDNGLLGAVCDPDALERKIRLLKENGYNAIRSAHNPCSKTCLDVCDRLGMYVMDEYIDHWYIHKTMYDYVDFFEEWWRQDLTDMVNKDYNHPCVVMYSTGNEVAETAQPKGIELARQMTELLHKLDNSRPVTCGINIFFNFLNSIGFGQYSDKKAAKEAERNAKAKEQGKKTKERATGSKFFNDMAGFLGADFMKTGAALHGSDVTTRKAFANMDIAGYNYGEKRYKKDLKKYPDRIIVGSETFCSDAYKFYELAKKEPRLIGDFVWAGFDYLGETGIGAWEYSDYAPEFEHGVGWIAAGSGRIDLTGKPLGEALYTRVAFEQETGPYIAVRPLHHTGSHSPSAWKMTNAMPSWSWKGCEGRKAYIEVYARGARVELFLNGASKGKKELKNDCVAVFRIPYENGTLTAISYDAAGKIIGKNELKTAEDQTVLEAAAEEKSVKAGHLAFIRLRFTDPQGEVKPMEKGQIRVSVKGGTLVALGSACPYYEKDYRSDLCDTYYGEALAIVRASEQGTVELTALGKGRSAQCSILIEA